MQFKSLAAVNQELQKYYTVSRQSHGDNNALVRMAPLLQTVSSPERSLRVIHVAGTSGKTSTCYYIAELLRASGKKVGLTVSPYVNTVLERVQLDGQPITEAEFCAYMGEFLELIGSLPDPPGYFEVMVAFALWFFKIKEVDYVVLETGIGGLYDSTNVIMRKDKVCVITDIGLDHMQVLGTTIPEITAQKAGIIQPQNDVFMYEQASQVMEVVEAHVNRVAAHLHTVKSSNVSDTKDIVLYQQRNFGLAKAVAAFVARRDGFTLKLITPSAVVIPGRMQIIRKQDETILVFDGAHNPQKMRAFVESFMSQFPNESADVLVTFKSDKEFEDVLKILRPIVSRLYITSLDTVQDSAAHGYHVASVPTQKVADVAATLSIDSVTHDDCSVAYSHLLRGSKRIKVVTGSLYLIGSVLKLGTSK